MPSSLPVLILTGYLGSGKTTVLNHFLATGGARIGVIINDFGDVNVDAALVAGHVAEPVSIPGGCLCCIEDPRQLDDALRALSRPSLELDAVVIEGSGIAEPPGLIHMVLGSEVRDVRFGGLVEVIAVARVALAEASGWDLAQHVKAAAVVLLTTTDLADPRETAAVRERIAHANPHALVIDAPHGAADPRLFFDAAEHPYPRAASSRCGSSAGPPATTTTSTTAPRPWTRPRSWTPRRSPSCLRTRPRPSTGSRRSWMSPRAGGSAGSWRTPWRDTSRWTGCHGPPTSPRGPGSWPSAWSATTPHCAAASTPSCAPTALPRPRPVSCAD